MTSIQENHDVLLDVRGLKVYFPIKTGLFRRVTGYVRAVDEVDFFVRQGETLGLVGESGCGKTTTARAVIRLVEATAGQVQYRAANDKVYSFLDLKPNELKALRKDIQIIFQDPYSSLNPRMTVGTIIAEPLNVYGIGTQHERREWVKELLRMVGLSELHVNRFPHEFSGGQRQRIGIARALALKPRLLICDEPVSALDVSVQAQILNLLEELKEQLQLSYLFVAHNLSVVHHVSDRVAVMYLGRIVELARSNTLYETPRHPYTEALMSAIPAPTPEIKPNHILLPGEVPNPAHPPAGCRFHSRCPYVIEKCRTEEPAFKAMSDDPAHFVACHRAEALKLSGAPHHPALQQRRELDSKLLQKAGRPSALNQQ